MQQDDDKPEPPESGPYPDLDTSLTFMLPDCKPVLDVLASAWASQVHRENEIISQYAGDVNEELYSDATRSSYDDFRENLIGACFVLLQIRIDAALHAFWEFEKATFVPKTSQDKVFQLSGFFKDTGRNLMQIIWDLANYYKHREGWSELAQVPPKGKKTAQDFTRDGIKAVGVKQRSRTSLQDALRYVGYEGPDGFGKLYDHIQLWEGKLLEQARKSPGCKGSPSPAS